MKGRRALLSRRTARTEVGERPPPRIGEVPGPRRSDSAIGPIFRRAFAWPYRLALAGLYRLGARAWHLTILSLSVNLVVAWLLLTGRRLLPGLLLLVAGILDVLDGGIARLRREDSPAGAFLDSVLDRVSDFVVFGALFWSLAGQGERLGAGLALASLIVALLVSHVRAEGEAVGLSLSEGLFQRTERYVALVVGLTAPGALRSVLALLTALGAVTVAQRARSAWRRIGRPGLPSGTGGEKE